MKKIMISVCCAILLMLAIKNVKAASYDLTIGDTYTLGTVVPGGSPVDLDNCLDCLIGMAAPYPATATIDSNVYTRMMAGNLPDPVYPGVRKDIGTAPAIPVDNILYIAAKYDSSDAGFVFWYLGGLNPMDRVTLPQIWPNLNPSLPGYDISSYTVWEAADSTSVPEPFTLLLLGLGLVSLAAIRKRISL